MDADLRTQVAFHLTSKRTGPLLDAVDDGALRPALLAGFGDLTKIRHDFPLVVLRGASKGEDSVQSLSAIVDDILREVAPRGAEGERMRRHMLRLEEEIRTLCMRGVFGSLTQLWDKAAQNLAGTAGFTESIGRARAALKVDGTMMACDADLPSRLVVHAWRVAQAGKLHRLRDNVARLALKLSDILQSDFAHSEAGRSAAALKASVGVVFTDAFDFDAMSRVLSRASPSHVFPEKRRARIEWALSVLRSQPFLNGADPDSSSVLDEYVFENPSAALEAFRRRLPRVLDFVKATNIAELEIEGRYISTEQDQFFEAFDETSLSLDDFARFPDYLVCVQLGTQRDPLAGAGIAEVLTSGLPIKVLAQSDDILGVPLIGDGAVAQSATRLGTMALGLGDVYVLQSVASNLYQLRDRLAAALDYRGATLINVFSGATDTSLLPVYLTAACAMQARAFPAFSYDPRGGSDFSSRFSLENNPAPASDWTSYPLIYEGPEHQRITESSMFTFVDFLACDERYGRHFARVPQAKSSTTVPAAEWLASPTSDFPDKVPFIWMTDANNLMQRVIVDESMMAAARRCRDAWHYLREFAATKPAGTPRLKDRSPASETGLDAAPAPAAAAASAPAASAPATETAPHDRASDDPYIETMRCTSCNECIQINNRMFAYDDNKQAYIANADGGPYAQLVEAAESCQVSIIHPGKPRNPNEPNLADLMKRAEPFL